MGLLIRVDHVARSSASHACWIGSALLVTLSIASSTCERSRQHSSPELKRIRIATGSKSGIYDPLGRALAEVYNARVPNVVASAVETTGSLFNVRAVQEGRAELAFSQADVAYFAFQGAPGNSYQYAKLRAMAVLYLNAVQVVALRDSDVYRIKDLSGRRVGVGAHESGTEIASHLILQVQGVDSKIRAESLTFDEIADEMKRHELDAGFMVSSYPVPAIAELSNVVGIRLISIDPIVANRVRSKYPFLRPIRIPKGTYKGQERDVQTMGVDNLLVCSSDLPDDLVHELTRVFIESSSVLSRVHPAAAAIDPEQAPAAPIPMHSGAIRLYRERQLLR
jgi:TRAP transporter TAXI family solute receptor